MHQTRKNIPSVLWNKNSRPYDYDAYDNAHIFTDDFHDHNN